MKYILISVILVLAVTVYVRTAPIREFYRIPVFKGDTVIRYTEPVIDTVKKNVFIVSYNKGTEIFDLIAPFYLFNSTGRSNVLIVAPEKKPVSLMKGLFILPHYSFSEIDTLQLKPDIVVIPNLSGMNRKEPDLRVMEWIKKRYSDSTRFLSVCAGSFTVSATGLYDGRSLTTHASDLKQNKKLFPRPQWVDGVSYARSGNLFSTAGVSNAVEGTLAVIREVFGDSTMRQVMSCIHYRHSDLRVSHQSLPVSLRDKKNIILNSIFKEHRNIGVWLQNGVDEFVLGAVLDSYHRSFPASLKTYSIHNKPVVSKFGLVLFPTGAWQGIDEVNELHFPTPYSAEPILARQLQGKSLVNYDYGTGPYIFDTCLNRIRSQYGTKVQTIVKRLLDYN